jgi:hypothetical protein
MKNECGKARKVGNPYEVWVSGDWTWNVLKKWQADDSKPYARWFCHVVTPMTGPSGDLGDVYVSEIQRNARKLTEQEIIARESAAFRVRS